MSVYTYVYMPGTGWRGGGNGLATAVAAWRVLPTIDCSLSLAVIYQRTGL